MPKMFCNIFAVMSKARQLLGCLLVLLVLWGVFIILSSLLGIGAHSAPSRKLSIPKGSLTRLGTDLKVDMDTCPPGSMMTPIALDDSWSQPPLHNDCPDLFIIGMRKSGSTSLIQYLSKHPDFGAPNLDKGPMAGETFYFDDVETSGLRPWKSYKEQFPTGKLYTGESTVDYIERGPERIYRNCGTKPKFVILLREPVDRFVSNFVMKSVVHSDYGTEAITQKVTNETHVHDVVTKEIAAYQSRLPSQSWKVTLPDYLVQSDGWSLFVAQFARSTSMLFHGLYYVHVMNWFCNYPAENILIINSEEFFAKPSAIVKQVSQFIGLRALPDAEYNRITAVAYNKGGYSLIPPHHQISVEDRARLAELYKPFNEVLLNLLEWPLKWN